MAPEQVRDEDRDQQHDAVLSSSNPTLKHLRNIGLGNTLPEDTAPEEVSTPEDSTTPEQISTPKETETTEEVATPKSTPTPVAQTRSNEATGSMEELSPFTSWLASMAFSPTPEPKSDEVLVDPVVTEPLPQHSVEPIKREKASKVSKASKKKKKKKKKRTKSEDYSESVTLSDDVFSETLADLLAAQGHYQQAILMYKKMSLIYPEKSRFFAAKIEELNKKE